MSGLALSDQKIYAVLTGDLVGSTKVSSRDLAAAQAVVVSAVDLAKTWSRGAVKGKPEFFRGDSWQALLAEPRFALRTALLVRASLIASKDADTRIAIGIGGVEKISSKRVSLSVGGAFTESGRALDEMGRQRLTIVVDPSVKRSVGALSDWLPAIGGAADAFVSGWTGRQAALVALALSLPAQTQEAMADRMKIARPTITKTLEAAHWRAVNDLIKKFEATPWVYDPL